MIDGDTVFPDDGHHPPAHPTGRRLAILTLTALGVVYGDIGTSPLYALRECFALHYGLTPTPINVYGVLALIVWSLLLVVAVKYIVFIMRADNRGEGGILALLALLLQRQQRASDARRRALYVGLGLFGAALLYGDGIITPAISVLGAMEGLAVATPAFERFIIPVSLVILFALFFVQKKGTARVGRVFGPLVLVWFTTIAVLGVREIALEPRILLALNPWYALRFFLEHGVHGLAILGAVVLAVTGAEALYADMGHFGRRPIRLAWFALVLPALLLNYFGQGALILRDPAAAANPFYLLAPRWFLYPLIGIATLAAIVASQALISGAFSLTQQTVQLGFSPRVRIVHTSKHERGQIYVPSVNTALMVGCLLLVLTFQTVSALGAMYGIAVTGTMVITSLLFGVIARTRWHWPLALVLLLEVGFLTIDVAFLGANVIKIHDGGWVPLLIAAALFTLMSTWREGRHVLRGILLRSSLPVELFLEDVARTRPTRVPGTAIFMTPDLTGAPVVLLHHLKHNKVLHQQVLLLTITSAEVPEVPSSHRLTVEPLGQGFHRLHARYGFMQRPDMRDILECAEAAGLHAGRPTEVSYYLGHERLLPTGRSKMARWRKRLFALMSRNAQPATDFFGLPPNRVVELGAQIEF
ncbi:MAG TPA: potassium transporter Kup [Gemmatimonadaceae bacterium]|nr:potassium transporter Kup [Gemmatimonadaceae bacterium]